MLKLIDPPDIGSSDWSLFSHIVSVRQQKQKHAKMLMDPGVSWWSLLTCVIYIFFELYKKLRKQLFVYYIRNKGYP